MLISFFTHTEYVTEIDYATSPDCLYSEDIEINLDTHIPLLIENNGEYSIEIQEKPLPPESPQQKHARIYHYLISGDLENLDLEGESFSDFEIGEIIMVRVFGGNPHAQMAFMAKMQAMTLSGIPNPELITKAQEIEVKINEVRNLFNLGNL